MWDFDPGKDFGKDYQTWNWGGSILVHQIHQHPDGTLGMGPVNSVSDAFTTASPVTPHALTGSWKIDPSQAFGCSENGYAAAIGDKIPPQCCIRLQCSYHGNAAGFGLAFKWTRPSARDTITISCLTPNISGYNMYNYRERNLGFYVSDGGMTIKNAAIWIE